MRLLKGQVSKRFYVVSVVITAIFTLVVTLLGSYFSAYFNSLFNPKPNVYIVKENCAITPLWGTNYIAFKGVITNKGSTVEKSILVRIDLSQPFVHLENNLSSIERNIGDIRAGQTLTFSTPILGPSPEYIRHCSITLTVTVFGESKVWDTCGLSETW